MSRLYVKQAELEQAMFDEAVLRNRKDVQNRGNLDEWSDSRLGKRFVSGVMNQVSTSEHISFIDTLASSLSASEVKKVGRGILGMKLLRQANLKPEVLAYLASKTILNSLGLGKGILKRSTLCDKIAKAIEGELAIIRFQDTKERRALLKKLFADFDKKTYPKEWRKRTVQHYFDAEGIDWAIWDTKQRLHVGYVLLKIFIDTTGLVHVPDDTHVEPSETLLERIEYLIRNNSGMFTLYRPMVVPPVPWDYNRNLFKGGYTTSKVRKYALIKGSGKRDVERLMKADLSQVIPAINALQETPWRINKWMLEAETWTMDVFGGGVGAMISADEEPMPPTPFNYLTDEAVRKEHNRARFECYSRRRQDKTRRISAMVTLAMAKEFVGYDNIYYPHSLDSRGRAYPQPAFLTPQGTDYAKALLEFGNGKPVTTQSQLNWIAIAGANAYGEDKCSLVDRVKWVERNEEMILSCADDYTADHRWMQASEPFQFLRFCYEWSMYKTKGLGYMSHMVCPVDATNSGLQHFSAALRDEVGGRSVNLIPGLPRQDIYQDVANLVIQKLVTLGTPEAKDWLSFGINRKLTKRQVMVKPYNGKFSSCLDYTRDAVKERLNSGEQVTFDMAEFNDRTLMLARLIWEAIHEVVIKAGEAMEWLSKIASEHSKTANKSGIPLYERRMEWTTPDGFPVVHMREGDAGLHRVETTFEGKLYLSFRKVTGKLDPKDMAQALPPNFIHALDATHLRMTIIRAMGEGIADFGMVHDSFGTHAANMDRFVSACVKPAFIDLYSNDVLGNFADTFPEQSRACPRPENGSLDLARVQDSEFFFS